MRDQKDRGIVELGKRSILNFFVEHAGGRIEVFEVDRFLLERLLEHLERCEA